MTDTVITTGLKCGTCGHHTNPRKQLLYPNTDNDAVGWVICGIGNVVKKASMGCMQHTERPQEEKPKRQLVHTPQPQGRRLIK